MSIHTAALLYMSGLVILSLALAQLGDVVRPSQPVVEQCVISVYHGGNRVTYVGRGEVWK